jgi:GntR family transcriptional regulator
VDVKLEFTPLQGASLHHQIMTVLRSQIVSGQLGDGAMVPGETTLMAQYGVSRATVRRALLTLEGEGLIERRQGKVTRVTYRPAAGTPSMTKYIRKIEDIAASTKVKVLAFEWALAAAEAQAALGLAPADKALRIVRVRSAGKTPLRHIVNVIPPAIGEQMHRNQFARATLPTVLQELGHEFCEFEDTVSAVVADPELARSLEVMIGAPLVDISRVIYGPGKTPLAYQRTLVPPGRVILRVNIQSYSD